MNFRPFVLLPARTRPDASSQRDSGAGERNDARRAAAPRPLGRPAILPKEPRWKCRRCRAALARIRRELICETCE